MYKIKWKWISANRWNDLKMYEIDEMKMNKIDKMMSIFYFVQK